MLSDHTPLQRFGYTLMGCIVAFGIAFVIARGLRQPAKIELHQTAQEPVVIPPDPPYGSKRSDFTTHYAPIQSAETATAVTDAGYPVPDQTSPVKTSSHGKHPTAVVNLNTATEQDLQTLPGIGPATAKKIVDFRQSNGPFQSVDDLQAIPGFGKKKVDKIRQWLTVNQ